MEVLKHGTRKNKISKYNKPNEDYYLFDSNQGIAIVADGVSRSLVNGTYPNPSPAAEVVKIICSNVVKGLFRNPSLSLKEAVLQANNALAILNSKIDYFKPGATLIVCRKIDVSSYEYCYIGDPLMGLLDGEDFNNLLYPQTKPLYETIKTGTRLSEREIRGGICNNIQHPLGYGVLDGSKECIDFITEGTVTLEPKDSLFLMSDGFELLTNKQHTKHLSLATFNKLANEMEKLESKNKIRSDDKTLIHIK